MWLGIQDVWVWDSERDKVPVDGGIKEMFGDYICVEVHGVQGCHGEWKCVLCDALCRGVE